MSPFPPLFEAIESALNGNNLPADAKSEIWSRFGKKLAVMVVDSCGFTRISKSHGILHYLACLVRMRQIGLASLEKNGALQSKAEADNLFALFDCPQKALQAAFELHRSIDQAEIALSDRENFRVCIGIGFGDVLDAGHEGVYGEEMNLASKLGEDTAEGNEILMTEAAHKAIAGESHEGFEERALEIAGIRVAYFAGRYRAE